jgi:glycine/D-amino acid oxidase-like deaminating enzyme
VRSFRTAGHHVDAVVIDRGEVRVRSVLICVGPATKAFLAPLGIEMPVDRVYGLLAITSRPDIPLQRLVHVPGVHLRPDAGGGLVLGANDNDLNGPVVEMGSSHERAEIATRMVERARVVFPAARDVKVVEYRVGVRPMPADGHGAYPGIRERLDDRHAQRHDARRAARARDRG